MRNYFFKFLGVLLLHIFTNKVQAQFTAYSHKYNQTSYEELKNPSIIFSDTFWIDTSYAHIGYELITNKEFGFTFRGEKLRDFWYDVASFRLSAVGQGNQVFFPICFCWMQEPNLTAPFKSSLSFVLDSSKAERILKFQFKDFGIADSNRKIVGSLNLQFWFYEYGNMKVIYGNSTIPLSGWINKHGKFKTMLYQASYDTFANHQYDLVGNYDSPRGYKGKNAVFFNLMKDSTLSPMLPPSGSEYLFYLPFSGVEDAKEITLNFYPNPVTDKLYIGDEFLTSKAALHIFDLNAREIAVLIKDNYIETQDWLPGIYFLSLELGSKRLTHKIIKL